MNAFFDKLKKMIGPELKKILTITGIVALIYLIFLWFEKQGKVKK